MTKMIDHLRRKLESVGFDIFDISVDWGNKVSIAKHFEGVDDPDLHVENYTPKILYYPNFEENQDYHEEIGYCSCSFIDGFDASGKKADMLEAADAHSVDLLYAVQPLFEENHDLETESDLAEFGILYVHHIHIEPKYRNNGIGTAALSIIMHYLAPEMGLTATIINKEEAIAKRMFDRLNFYPIKNDNKWEVWLKRSESPHFKRI